VVDGGRRWSTVEKPALDVASRAATLSDVCAYLSTPEGVRRGVLCLRGMTGINVVPRQTVAPTRTQLKAVIYKGGKGRRPPACPRECARGVSITAAIHVQKGFVRGAIRKRVHGLRGGGGGGGRGGVGGRRVQMQMRGSHSYGVCVCVSRMRPAYSARTHTYGRERGGGGGGVVTIRAGSLLL